MGKRNSSEKFARTIVGTDTEAVWSVDGVTAADLRKTEDTNKFNDQVDAFTDKFAKHLDDLNSFAEELSENMAGLEIMPVYGYCLIEPFKKNPFQKIEVDKKSGLITDLGGMAIEYKSEEDGQVHEEDPFIKVGTVVEVGHTCEFIKPGDIVMYPTPSEVVVPFYNFGFRIVNEQRIIAVINDKLTERKNNIKK